MAQLRKRKAGQELATEKAAAATTSKRQKLPMRAKADELPPAGTIKKGTLVTFDDGQAEQNVESVAAPTPAPSKVDKEASNDSEDDDAAPEAVSTAQVATDLKKSEQAAQTAARKQAAAEKRKRQKRDSLLKKQAEERKRTGHDALAAAVVPPQEDGQHPSSGKIPTDTGKRRRSEKLVIPDILPAELLDDSSSEDEEQVQARRPTTNSFEPPRKRNIADVESRLTRLDKAPRDKVVKSTVFRVAAKVDQRFMPKAGKNSLSARERLLRRNRKPEREYGLFSKK
ncbi:hypothetical protein XA68_14362 [Ophiocordyceps unilateralis]|uniref:U3 snoRNA associated n=1 Tax=Ophiocordyceps unilateralis TaxID=268505 RepID=A0A2A9PAJ1_OPHUN|nr:hypothetical protein XA68_14362 [Ophiocordyceps unilateralis]